ncbi:hypothetical protein [Chamaesiphon sp.]|uniref:hypothetical protein n=1 Tax=Chamaesiphon sp. TaxID=2814140 RepID=UPI003593A369
MQSRGGYLAHVLHQADSEGKEVGWAMPTVWISGIINVITLPTYWLFPFAFAAKLGLLLL